MHLDWLHYFNGLSYLIHHGVTIFTFSLLSSKFEAPKHSFKS